MSVGILTLELQIPGCNSLKEKRSRIKPLITRLHREFNISVAELHRLDKWDETIIGCAMISNDHTFLNNSLGVIIHWLERNWPDVTLVDNHIEIIT